MLFGYDQLLLILYAIFLQVKTKITVSGDTLLQVQDFNKKRTFTFRKEFTDNTLKEVIDLMQAYRFLIPNWTNLDTST